MNYLIMPAYEGKGQQSSNTSTPAKYRKWFNNSMLQFVHIAKLEPHSALKRKHCASMIWEFHLLIVTSQDGWQSLSCHAACIYLSLYTRLSNCDHGRSGLIRYEFVFFVFCCFYYAFQRTRMVTIKHDKTSHDSFLSKRF